MSKKRKVSILSNINKSKKKNDKYKIPKEHKVQYREHCPYFGFSYCIDKPQGNTFSCIQKTSEFCLVFKNFKRISSKTWKEIEQSHDFHAHPVEKYSNFPKKAQDTFDSLDNPPPYQFKIFKEARIFGFFNSSNIFEIVFFDRKHNMY